MINSHLTVHAFDRGGVIPGLDEEVFKSLEGPPTDARTRATWATWGPVFAATLDIPLWLFAVYHVPSSVGPFTFECPDPSPRNSVFMTSQAPTRSISLGIEPPQPGIQCAMCWTDLVLMSGKDMRFLFLPDGRIVNPYGEHLI